MGNSRKMLKNNKTLLSWARRLRGKINFFADGLLNLKNDFNSIKRDKSVYINFVLHIEEIANKSVYKELRKFCKNFFNYTLTKPTLCITTPECPYTAMQLRYYKTSKKTYESRVRELKEFSEINYHGHFFTFTDNKLLAENICEKLFGADNKKIYSGIWKNKLIPIYYDNYDLKQIETQIKRELNWLNKIGIQPEVFVAGWWFMTKEIANMLEGFGFKIDCSLRKNHLDTFGKKYLKDEDFSSRGETFILPPTKRLVEVQSVFYPIKHSYRTINYLKEVLNHRPEENLFIVFPSHESEIITYKKEIWENIKTLTHKSNLFQWKELSEIKKIIYNKESIYH